MTYQGAALALCEDMPDAPYLEALLAHARSPVEHLTVPGHKRGTAAPAALAPLLADAAAHDVPLLIAGLDLPAASEADHLDAAAPPLAEAERRAARAWGAARTWFLTQGATQGNLAAALTLPAAGGPVVVQRSAHVSTFNGLALAGSTATWVSPQLDAARGIAHAVTPADLDLALRRTPGARAVLLTSPTYHGTTADLASLVRVARRHGAAVIVDEAWGAHLRFAPHLPIDALSAGADLVISSTHKHLGSLGGSAMLHLGHEAPSWLTAHAIERALALVTSTSPSSLLLASLDAARARAERHGEALLTQAGRTLDDLRAAIAEIPGCVPLGAEQIGRYGIAGIDPLRLCIDVRGTGWSGLRIARLARTAHALEVELAQPATIVLCFGLGEAPAERGRRLVAALADAAAQAGAGRGARARSVVGPATHGARSFAAPAAFSQPVLPMREALWARPCTVAAREAIGRIAAEPLTPYPPGIPLVVPGERIEAGHVARVQAWIAAGGAMRGLADPTAATLRVVDGTPAAAPPAQAVAAARAQASARVRGARAQAAERDAEPCEVIA